MTFGLNSRQATFALAAALAAAVAVIYFPTLHGAWIWDDYQYVAQNWALRSVAGLRSIWFAPDGVNYFPVTFTVQWLQWHLWGDAVAGYHVTNVALHLLNGLLLWRILVRLGAGLPGLVALLFAVHPLAVESVAWISELKNVLSLTFLFASALAYLRFERAADPLRIWYLFSWGFFVLAMLSKSTVAPFPVVLALHAWCGARRISGRCVLVLLPFFAVALTLGVVTIWFEHHRAMAAEIANAAALPLFSRIAGAGLALAFYLEKALLPVGLLPSYPQWRLESLTPWLFVPWPVAAAIFCFLARWSRGAAFGWGYFVLMLAPTLGLVPMAYLRISWVADHFAYAALPGLLAVIGGGLAVALRRVPASLRWLGFSGAVAIGLALVAESRSYARVYRNEETLWTTVLARNPQSWLAHNQLGGVWLRQGKLDEATLEFAAATRINPGYVEGRNNLGVALEHAGRLSEAIEQFQDALQLRPDYRPALANLAGAHLLMGDSALRQGLDFNAVEEYRAALAVQPDDAAVENHLGVALVHLGRTAEAVEHYRRALHLRPNYPEARINLGNALRKSP